MSGIRYTRDHEWVVVDGETARVGISDYAQDQLGDIVFVEVTALGDTVARGDVAAVIESVKAASDIYSPVSGTVSRWNEALETAPEAVNEDAEGTGWILEVSLSDPGELDELMDAEGYAAFLASLEGPAAGAIRRE